MDILRQALGIIDNKTKPQGSLGQLEALALQICHIQNSIQPALNNPHMLVFAADHGLAQAGVSAFPAEVTPQMVLNFVGGGAAINIFTRQHGMALDVVDAGVNTDFEPDLPIKHRKVAHGTANMLNGPAMSKEQFTACRDHAAALIDDIHQQGCNIVGFGEMGIGNTSSAALILHYLTQLPIAQCAGRGTGLDDAGLQRKIDILGQVVTKHGALETPNAVMQAVGGFEIAMMGAAMLQAADKGMIVLVDGFIATAAALWAATVNPASRNAMIFCHMSAEQAHRIMLDQLQAQPVLSLDLRLGEGTGCALALPVIESAVRFFNDMASFDDAGVSREEDK